MSKRKVRQSDKNRVVLTETLPYEVPVLFSNAGFYQYLNGKKTNSFFEKILKREAREFKIPFNYKIRTSQNKYRTLSVIHPSCQREFIKFYDEYNSIMLHCCNKSSFSLRYPHKIASQFSEIKIPKIQLSPGEVAAAETDESTGHASSYFAYKTYPLIYKFYDSYEFIRIEKKFKKLMKFDISKCFYNIYTHSISWAIKEKSFSKKMKDAKSFEETFDKLMQSSNYNETNGIVVGPEISRIFAEIILQSIDLDILVTLSDLGFLQGVDYEIRRYVDDYFVFTTSTQMADKIHDLYSEKLEEFKLYINEKKTEHQTVPFISDISIAKEKLRRTTRKFLSKIRDDSDEEDESVFFKDIKNPSKLSNLEIKNIKSVLKETGVSYESISGFVLSIYKKNTYSITRSSLTSEEASDNEEIYLNGLFVILDVVFFIYSMDVRVRSTYIVSQIVISINNFLKDKSPHLSDTLKKKIFDEITHIIRQEKIINEESNVEILNLLIALRNLGEGFLLDKEALSKMLKLKKNTDNLISMGGWSYFELMTLLYYIRDKKKYSVIYASVLKEIETKLTSTEDVFTSSELTCLFLDMLGCPYIRKIDKKEMVKDVLKKINKKDPGAQEINEIVNYGSRRNWFFNWKDDIDLEHLLIEKELKFTY